MRRLQRASNSDTLWLFISHRPESLTAPLARMNEQHSPAISASEVRRPSKKLTTSPQTMPSGRPLAKIATHFH